ncbi:hypothetical protein [Actinomycetospora sp. TBRC 11914]|uniref:hypothetical protein n=1 Tax=Actinomycetospora sp. TBRC 11914 TaxID=2729387 RepID=UPI00145E285D|nr:hypothetical protein [Actinomycetospora sp. TBRC 11914]NMO88669.1 hypothetical protein [Actinomycetospora sp. TBRC 11914]
MSAPVPPGPGPVAPPVQASDPARLTNGQVVPRQVVEMPTGGSFTVDLERAPQTLRDLTAARDELLDLVKLARALGRVDPGAGDQVSRDAATLLGAVADGGSGSLLSALEAGAMRLDQLIGAVKAELRAYRSSEDTTQGSFDETRS